MRNNFHTWISHQKVPILTPSRRLYAAVHLFYTEHKILVKNYSSGLK